MKSQLLNGGLMSVNVLKWSRDLTLEFVMRSIQINFA